MKFKDLNIIEPILKAVEEKGYKTPTTIQKEAIQFIASGLDVMGCAQTGTGKTAAFAIPLLQRLYLNKVEGPKKIRVLVLTPTRELAIQIRDNFREYGKYTDLKCSVIFGGVNQKSQIEVLKKGVDILVATPGRLLDLIGQKYAKLNQVECLVLDEADSMLDMGFIHDVKRVISHIPRERQTLLFSATMPKEIETLASALLYKPKKVIVTPVSSPVDVIKQSVYFVDKGNKSRLLLDILLKHKADSVLVFTKTKHGANKLVEFLLKRNMSCVAIHGNKPQKARQIALTNFKNKAVRVLVATDIAARGIDIKELPLVVNYDLPDVAETYVHRIGRTGRAGLGGEAIAFCNIDDQHNLSQIEKLMKKKIDVIEEHKYPMLITQKTKKAPRKNESRTYTNRKQASKTEKPKKVDNRNRRKTEKPKFNKSKRNQTGQK